jgi:predicted nucleic acid-binding protein
LRSRYSTVNSRKIIGQFKTIVNVLSVDSKTIDLAVASGFNDFEDAIQYYCAIENNLTTIVTRNIKDYKRATIKVLTPDTFIAIPR